MYPRKRADEIFREALSVLQVGKCTKWIMFQAVRYIGWNAWEQAKREKRAGISRIIEVPSLTGRH